MSISEISFRIKYDYPFIKMSDKYPGNRISMWCVWDREMIHVPMEHENLMAEIERYVKSIGRSLEGYKPSSRGLILTLRCTCNITQSMWDVMTKNHCVNIDPAVFLDGWGYYRAISFNEEDTKGLFSDLSKLGPWEMISKRPLHTDAIPSTVWIESFFSRLTERQMEAIVKAYDYGYYSSPREVTTDSVASSLGISRSTYEEHLRKAENRIIEAIIPYLKLFKAGARKRDEMILPKMPIAEAGQQ